MIYVFCPRRSTGAFELVKALDAHRLKKFDGIDFWEKRNRRQLGDGDVVVCWGATIPEIDGVRVLNALESPLNKLKEWEKLVNAGVATITLHAGVSKPHPLLLPRSLRHEGGMDLLVPISRPDYYTQREEFVNEFRIHSFDKRSIRAGVKVPREGFSVCLEGDFRLNAGLVHPWVRSFNGGWRVSYDGFKSTPDLRNLAHKAVAALGLTFGAVDIGQLSSGGLKVLEVNRAPGIEGGTVMSYVRAITRWVKQEAGNDTGGIRVGAVPSVDVDE